MNATARVWLSCTALVFVLTGCSSTTTPADSRPTPNSTPSPAPTPINVVVVPQDAVAFEQLAKAAPTSLKLEGGAVTSTVCWTPSEHIFNDLSVAPAGTWKVLCRVYYYRAGAARYQDATCIGDFDLTPMLDHCYVWEYYTGEAKYDEGDQRASPAPTPLP